MKKLYYIIIFTTLFSSVTTIAQSIKIVPDDASVEDSFGWCVSVDGDYLAIGSVYDDDLNIQSGSVYVYKFDGTNWLFQQKLLASDGGYAQYFGYSVEISGNKIIVGAYRGHDEMGIETGTAYIYERSGEIWEETAILQPEGEYDDRIGDNVSIDGDYAVVGAWGDDDIASNSGAAYLFHKDGADWTLVEKITPENLIESSAFSVSLAITDEYLAIGAGKNEYSNSGAVYIYYFDGTGWLLEEEVTAIDGTEGQYFGSSVSLYGTTLVVGSYHDDIYGTNSGSAYIFEKDGNWTQTQKLIPPMGHYDDRFGSQVSIWNDDILCSAMFYFEENYNSGAVFYFHNEGNEWEYASTIKQPDPVSDANFGMDVCANQGNGLVGVRFDNGSAYRSGSAYLFKLEQLLSINESIGKTEQFKILPTITNDILTIQKISVLNKTITIHVNDLQGRKLNTYTMPIDINELKLNIENYDSGIYVISFSDGSDTFESIRVVRK